MISILDWFDIENLEHVDAYNNIRKSGGTTSWPKGLLPEDIVFPDFWEETIKNKIYDKYINIILYNKK